MTSKTLAQWLQHLETLHPNEMELGLDRVSQVADTLGLLPLSSPVVTVAGTNGKGSTVAVLESLLRECGFRPGAFTSPHFLRFNERIRVDGNEAQDEQLIAAFEAIEGVRDGISLTYFEFSTLAALMVFEREEVDYVLLEVGLGGRLDSANMVDADIAVITSIDTENRRLSLSIKDLEPNAWEKFVNEHKPGDVVRGKIAPRDEVLVRVHEPVSLIDVLDKALADAVATMTGKK